MADSPFTNEDLETISRTWNSNKYTEHTAMVLAKELLQARAALSHAAGQDGEQCRAASVASGEVQDVIEGIPRALNLAHRLIMAGPKAAHVSASETHEISEWIEEAADALRALSRSVPEGNQAAVDSVIRQYCRTCGGCGEIGGHSGQTPESYEEWSAPCPDCSPAAIAAQRKEG